MDIVAFDTETALIRPGRAAPELVCISWQRPGEEAQLVHGRFGRGALDLVTGWLTTQTRLVGHNVAYDLAVFGAEWPHLVQLIFKAYDEDRVACTKVRQQLLDIAAGEFRGRLHVFDKEIEVTEEDIAEGATPGSMKTIRAGRWIPHTYDLEDLVKRATGRAMPDDTWRKRYWELAGVPLEQWPEDAKIYALDDARGTLDGFLSQEVHVEFIPDQFRQARNAWARHLTSAWGIRTQKDRVDALEKATHAALAGVQGDLIESGLVRPDGSRDTKRAMARMRMVCVNSGKPVRLTEKGRVSLDSDACEASEDPILEDYAEITFLRGTISRDIPMLRAGVYEPIHTSFGMAASGRSTSSKPNVQNPKRRNEVYRDGKLKYALPDVREAFVPRPGKIFALADFAALELRTLAQTCISLFGYSTLGDALNAGIDPHTDFAARVSGIPYEEGVKRNEKKDKEFENRRQMAKSANFGFPGGLGIKTLCYFARKSYNVKDLTEERARELKVFWIERWPEMQLFFNHAAGLIDENSGKGTMQQLFSDRWRGGCSYTAICNTHFQGTGADAAHRALYLVQHACFAEPGSILYGSRPVNFVHDEIIMEVDDDARAHDKAVELARLMCVGANEFLPDVPAKVEPLLARCWSKKSKAVFDEQKRLVAWSPAA